MLSRSLRVYSWNAIGVARARRRVSSIRRCLDDVVRRLGGSYVNFGSGCLHELRVWYVVRTGRSSMLCVRISDLYISKLCDFVRSVKYTTSEWTCLSADWLADLRKIQRACSIWCSSCPRRASSASSRQGRERHVWQRLEKPPTDAKLPRRCDLQSSCST